MNTEVTAKKTPRRRGPDSQKKATTKRTAKRRGPDADQNQHAVKLTTEVDAQSDVGGHVDNSGHDDIPAAAWPIIDRLRKQSGTANSPSWQMASDIYELVHVHKLTQDRVAELVGLARNTVSEHCTAEKAAREAEAAEDGMPDFRQRFGVHKAKEISTNFRQTPKRIQAKKTIADYARDAENNSARVVRRDWVDEDQTKTAERNAKDAPRIKSQHDLGKRVTLGCCVKWLDGEIKKGSRYRVLYADPPYAYTTNDKLPIDHSQVSGLSTACANADKKEAIEVTTDVISRAEKLLTKDEGDGRGGGVLLMAQAAGQIILPEIIDAIEQAGLDIRFVVALETGHSKLANPAHPFGRSSEYLLVIKRMCDDLVRCDTARPEAEFKGSSNIAPHTSIVTERQLRVFAAEWQLHRKRRLWRYHEKGLIRMNASKQHQSSRVEEDYEYGECHLFQKSEAQLALILGKFALPGDKIADLFGCHGSCCIAADQLGLDWYYVEKHEVNHDRALRRFDAYLTDKAKGLEATDDLLEEWAFEAEADRMNTTDIRKMLKQNQKLKEQIKRLREE